MSWLNQLVLEHSEYESPKSFWYWGALSAISAVVKDNIWLDKFAYKLYPNIYVMYHADSGLKKGAPIAMAKQLARACGIIPISGRSSIQGILKKMGTSSTQPGGKITNGSKVFIASSELTSSLVEDKAAATILTDLYDRNYNFGEWESLLKQEVFSLKDATITMLTATNEAQSEDFFTRKDIHGGYFARTFVIYESEPQCINSLMFPPKYQTNYEKSASYLKELQKLHGPLEMSNETRNYFDNWYKEFKAVLKQQGVKDKTGTLNRFDDSILKVAINISLGNSPEPKISHEAVIEAIVQCEKLIGNIRRTTLGSGKSQWAQEKALIIEELIARPNHAITKMQLNKKYWMRANVSEWDEIMLSLETAGIIRKEQVGNNTIYEMPEQQVIEWKALLEGKNK